MQNFSMPLEPCMALATGRQHFICPIIVVGFFVEWTLERLVTQTERHAQQQIAAEQLEIVLALCSQTQPLEMV
jgi:hypothetical protein